MSSFYTSVTKYGNRIFLVEYRDGIRHVSKIKFEPTVFRQASPDDDTDWHTMSGAPMVPTHPGTMKETDDYVKTYSADNYKILHNSDYVAQFIAEKYPRGCSNTWDKSLVNVLYVDLECKSDAGFPVAHRAEQPITAITVKNSTRKKFYSWGIGDYDAPDNVNYTKCKDEEELLKKFLTYWAANVPDVISGWNVKFFDMPYIINRVARIIGEDYLKALSIFKMVPYAKQDKNGHHFYNIIGTTIMDYMEVFKKFGFTFGPQENYKLDTIAHTVLGEKKLDYSEYGSLTELYMKDHQKFMDYNVHDTALVERMEETAGLLSVALTLAYKANTTYDATFGTTRIWDTFIYNVLHKKHIVLPEKKPAFFRRIEGGHVKEPITGMHNWAMSFDAKSLYPFLIMMYNMSPETVGPVIPAVYVNKLLGEYDHHVKEKLETVPDNHCVAANGCTFRTDIKGIFPEIIDALYSERASIKKIALKTKQQVEDAPKDKKGAIKDKAQALDNEQNAIKILMNSLYGAMASKFFRYFDANVAEAITMSGQLSIQWAERTCNDFMNITMKTSDTDYVLAIDTDSIYMNFGPLIATTGITDPGKITKLLDKIAVNKVVPLLASSFKGLQTITGCKTQMLEMDREIIASKMVFTGKKKYLAHVLNNEGVQYEKPKLKVVGIESVRSSTPMFCRELIKEALEMIMTEDEVTVQDFLQAHREEFNKLPPTDVAFPRGVHGIKKYSSKGGELFIKGTPIHVRGSILYNDRLIRLGLENKYEKIFDDDKVRFCYLKMPNILHQNVIAFPVVLPEEFEMDEYIDYDLQYDKSFIEPMRTIMEAIGWSVEKRSTLEDFFS